MKTKLYLSIISFCLILFVFISLSFAWMTLGEQTESNDLNSSINQKDFSYSLFSYQNDSWVLASQTIELSELLPGDTFYFKLTLTNDLMDETLNLRANLKGYTSSLTENELQHNDNQVYVTDRVGNDIPLYDIDADGYVKIGNNTLYDCTDTTVKIADYKIQNALVLYVLEDNDTPSLTNATTLESLSSYFVSSINLIADATTNIYFAITFPSTTNDNYYQFQTLVIDGVVITII